MSKLLILDDFNDWNEWYAHHKIEAHRIHLDPAHHQNQVVVIKNNDVKDIGIVKGEYLVKLKYYNPCGIKAKNDEQLAALAVLGDPSIPLKVLSGEAGSGKTLLAIAHALHKLEKGSISKIIMAKSLTPVGREIGYLKGDMMDKVMPWLGNFFDNMQVCGIPNYQIEHMIEKGLIEITPITFIQGRSISDAVVIVDEVQNLDLATVKQIITRAAAGTEILLLGDQTQRFERTVKDSTIDILIERGRTSPLVGTVYLAASVRSPLAQWGVKNL